jgi:hypothetical protein
MADSDNPEFDVHDEAEMEAIHNFDFGRALTLMSIAEKVATVAPRATSLLGIAQAELEILNEKAKDIARKRAEHIRHAEERKAKAEQDRVNAENEAKPEDSKPASPQPKAIPGPGEPSPQRVYADGSSDDQDDSPKSITGRRV